MTYINKNDVWGTNFMIFLSMKQRNGALHLSKSARTQREKCAGPLVALFLNLVSFKLLISRTRKIRVFWNLRIVLSNGKMH